MAVMTDSSSPTTGRPERLRNTLYANMMKPDEDLSNMSDPIERRRIQNRLAQRAYRRKMRDQKNEVEKLRDQIKRLQEGPDGTGSRQTSPSTPSPENVTPRALSPQTFELSSPIIEDAQWTTSYYAGWPDSSGSDSSMAGSMTPGEADTSIPFDESKMMSPTYPCSFYSPTQGTFKSPTTSLSKLSTPQSRDTRPNLSRSISSPDVAKIACHRPYSSWGGTQGSGMDLQAVSSTIPIDAEPQGQFQSAFGLPTHPEEFQYPSPPNTESPTSWKPASSKSKSRGQRALSNPDLRPNNSLNTAPRSLPDANAPILHLAVAGGHIDTLRILLRQCQVSVNVRDSAGYTPLQRAIISGHTEIVALLLKHGAEVGDN
ncbi:hypothetical protein F4775DRAFT_593800 [Biscogniauxia sp. FL1348]|nr:hypothetical protein F4775DRAFT_593800 [Biscogniauxia sp. FL1348]